MAQGKDEEQSKVDTRSTIAVLLVSAMIALAAYLAWKQPDSDAFKILLGALISTGFTAVIGYYFGSSSNADKKDASQSRVMEALAGPEPEKPLPWWELFSAQEQAAIAEAGKIDGTIQTFIGAAKVGKGKPADLDYLATAGVLTQARAAAIRNV